MNLAESRRGFLNWLLALPIVGTALTGLGSAAAFLWPPAQSRGGGMVELGPAGDFPEGQGVVKSLDSGPILVFKEGGKCRALSATCTHLGCPVKFRQAENDLFCSCHGGEFDTSGKPLKGPVMGKPLKSVQLKEIGGILFLDQA